MVPVEKSFDDRMFFYQFCKFNLSQSFKEEIGSRLFIFLPI